MLSQTEKIKRTGIFGYPVDITTREQAVDLVLQQIQNRQGIQIVTINPEIIAAADKNPELAKILREAELVIPDSTGVMLAIKSLGVYRAEKIPGIEFSWELMKKCEQKGFSVGFLGGSPDTADSLNIEVHKQFSALNVVFSHHGYFNESELPIIRQELLRADPHLLFVALGSPKQEFFIKQHKNILHKTSMIGVGGSFDIWAKKVKRAPVIFRISGLEWFYRLITQPSRFTRMFPVLPLFFFRILFDRQNLRLY